MGKWLSAKQNANGSILDLEQTLWLAADKLRKIIYAAEYLYTLHINPLSLLCYSHLPKLMKGEIRLKGYSKITE
jgi:hypothetical protein